MDLETWQSGLSKHGLETCHSGFGNLAMWTWKLGNLALANMNLERKNSQVQCFKIPIGMFHFWAIMQGPNNSSSKEGKE